MFQPKCWKIFFAVFLEISNTSTEGKEIFKFCKSPKKQQNSMISLPSGRVHGKVCCSPSENTAL